MAPQPAVDRLYDRGRLFGQVSGLVRTLAIAGHAMAAFQLLGRWRRLPTRTPASAVCAWRASSPKILTGRAGRLWRFLALRCRCALSRDGPRVFHIPSP
jgi:hypothetical protein